MPVPTDATDWGIVNWPTAFISSIASLLGGLFGAAYFVSGTKTTLKDHEARIVDLEIERKTLATKQDVADLKNEIVELRRLLGDWMLGARRPPRD